MKNQLKPTFAALTLLTAASTASPEATAGDISVNDIVVPYEFLQIAETVNSWDIKVTMRDEYAEGDFIIATFPGQNVLDFTDLNDSYTVAPSGNLKGVTIDFITSGYDEEADQTWIKYRITELAGASANTTVGVQVNLGSVTAYADKLAEYDDYVVSTISRTAYDNYPDTDGVTPDPLDVSETNSSNLFTMLNQFIWDEGTMGDSPFQFFDNTIDVIEDYRIAFTDSSLERSYWDIDINNSEGTPDFLVTVSETRITLTGESMFSWVIDEDSDTEQLEFGSQIYSSGSECQLESLTESEVIQVCTGEYGYANDWFNVVPNGEGLLQAGEFKISAEVSFGGSPRRAMTGYTLKASPNDQGSVELAERDFGEWDINGSETRIPYMPYSAQASVDAGSTGIDQILYVTNKSQKDYGDNGAPPIYIDVMTKSGEVETFTSDDLGGLTAGKGITKLAGALREAMFMRGLLDASQKVSITVTVPENPANIEVYSAYNVGGSDRGWVQNDSQRVYGHDQDL